MTQPTASTTLDDLVRYAQTCSDPAEQFQLTEGPPEVIHALALNRTLHPEVQDLLLAQVQGNADLYLATNPALTVENQVRLAREGDVPTCWLLASRRGDNDATLPPALALALAESADWTIRRELASNPSLALTEDLPAGFLWEYETTRPFVEKYLEGCDKAAADALIADWTGSLEEFRRAIRTLGPEPS